MSTLKWSIKILPYWHRKFYHKSVNCIASSGSRDLDLTVWLQRVSSYSLTWPGYQWQVWGTYGFAGSLPEIIVVKQQQQRKKKVPFAQRNKSMWWTLWLRPINPVDQKADRKSIVQGKPGLQSQLNLAWATTSNSKEGWGIHESGRVLF